MTDRELARSLAAEYYGKGDVLGWFEALYASAEGQTGDIPWADLRPNPNLTAWLDREAANGAGQRALVVGCGLGDDAECLASRGFRVTAFDIAPSAIDWCRRRFSTSPVDYQVQNLLALPIEWRRAFDLVVEIYTLQAVPAEPRAQALVQLAQSVAPGGRLLVICRGRDSDEPSGELPWKLARDEFQPLEAAGLVPRRFEDFADPEEPDVRRFRIEWRA